MAQPDSNSSGLAHPLHRILNSGFVILQSRLELFTPEVHEEKLRWLDMLLWALVENGLHGLGAAPM